MAGARWISTHLRRVGGKPQRNLNETFVMKDKEFSTMNLMPNTCEELYPTAINCSELWYPFSSPQEALRALKRKTGLHNLRLEKESETTRGPCPEEGLHYAVKHRGRYIASIVGCPCCQDSPSGPVMTWRFGYV